MGDLVESAGGESIAGDWSSEGRMEGSEVPAGKAGGVGGRGARSVSRGVGGCTGASTIGAVAAVETDPLLDLVEGEIIVDAELESSSTATTRADDDEGGGGGGESGVVVGGGESKCLGRFTTEPVLLLVTCPVSKTR